MQACLKKEDQLHQFLLKKIMREIGTGKPVLHVSQKQEQVEALLAENNHYLVVDNLKDHNFKPKSFSYVIADLDNADLDDFDSFLDQAAKLIVRPGLLMVIASNLCSFKNQLAVCFGNELDNFDRPNRAVPPGFLRNKLLRKGFFVKNRFWQYNQKLLIMADIPNHT